jgi:hypothetical protein
MLHMCVCSFSLPRESPDRSWGDEPLILKVVLSHILSCFKNPMQLRHGFLHTIHMKVHNEWLITHWERLENQVSSQVIVELTTKLVEGLNVTHHLDYMRTDRATLCQHTRKQGC